MGHVNFLFDELGLDQMGLDEMALNWPTDLPTHSLTHSHMH